MGMSTIALQNLQEWIALDKHQPTADYCKSLLSSNEAGVEAASKEINELFGEQIAFGTAGLRGKVGLGWTRMNTLTVQLATQGVCLYLERSGKATGDISVVVGRDHRHGSKDFHEIAARTFASRGFKVHLLDEVVPTPFVPFAVKMLKADFGVMITASHNPKDDNGYKVYGSNGCQIRSPTEGQIAELIMDKNRVLWDLPSSYSPSLPLCEIAKAYNEAMKTTFGHLINTIAKTPVVYTPMHGVGQRYVDALFHSLALPLPVLVDAQSLPDPNFPTVKFPNPEEGKGVLSLAMATAASAGIGVVFANDPDADRFNMAEKQSNGDWKIFNGNEIALLLADFAWRKLKDNNKDPSEYCMLASLVSSRILSKMAAKEGFFFEQAATGFKNLSNTGQEMQVKGKTVLFTYEEAIGFMVGTNVWDKDGISSMLTAYLLLQEVSAEHQTLRGRLDALWQKYGYQIQFNSYFYHQSASALKPIIAKLPGQFAQLKEITFKDDVLLKIDHIKTSNVLFLEFQSGAWIAIRASGTEPKIKFYSEIITTDSNRVETETERLHQLVLAVCNVLLDPSGNSLTLQEIA